MTTWDCTVIGGGAAGLSAALVLGRARRRTLVVDAGAQSNLAAHGIGGLLGQDGRPPAELYADGRAELAKYPSVEVVSGEIVSAEPGFTVTMADGRQERSRTLVLAQGMDYRPPDIPGLDALWGTSAFHCPFCHGWEVRDQPIAVVADVERGVHAGMLLRGGWSDDVVVITNGAAFGPSERETLSGAGVKIVDNTVAEFVSEHGELSEIVFTDGSRLPRRAVLVGTTLHQRSDLAAQLGVTMAPPGPVVVDAVAVDAFNRTSVPGVFAAGDVSSQMPQVASAIAAGSLTGIAVMQTLMAGDIGLTVPAWPSPEENSNTHA